MQLQRIEWKINSVQQKRTEQSCTKYNRIKQCTVEQIVIEQITITVEYNGVILNNRTVRCTVEQNILEQYNRVELYREEWNKSVQQNRIESSRI